MKIIVTIISKYLVTNLLLSSFSISYKLKTRTWFSGSWWSGKEKKFCLLFIVSRALLQSHAEFNRILYRNLPTCYSCSYCSSMIKLNPTSLHYYRGKQYKNGKLTVYLTKCCYLFLPFSLFIVGWTSFTFINGRVFPVLGNSTSRNYVKFWTSQVIILEVG